MADETKKTGATQAIMDAITKKGTDKKAFSEALQNIKIQYADFDVNGNITALSGVGGFGATSFLSAAVTNGKNAAVEVLISPAFNAEASKPGKDGFTPLVMAVQIGNKKAAELLIADGVDVNVSSPFLQRTPLQLAAEYGKKDMVELLLKQPTIDVSLTTEMEVEGKKTTVNAAQIATQNGHADIANIILIKQEEQSQKASVVIPKVTPMPTGLDQTIADAVQELKKYTPPALNEPKKPAAPAAKTLTTEQQTKATQAIVDAMDDFKDKASFEKTITEIKKTYPALDFGATVPGRYEGFTVLHHAARRSSNPDELKILLDAGAKSHINAPDKFDNIPLHEAAAANNPEVVKTLLAAGAKSRINAPNEYGWTPLHMSAWMSNNPEVVKTLLAAGATPDAKTTKATIGGGGLRDTNAGSTAVDLAKLEGFTEIADIILKAQKDPMALAASGAATHEPQPLAKPKNEPDPKNIIKLPTADGKGYEVDLSDTALDLLNLNRKQITDVSKLDVTRNTALVDLSLGGNQITDVSKLNLSKNTALLTIYLGENQIKDLTTLDVSNNSQLTYLAVHNNPLSKESYGYLAKLKEERPSLDVYIKDSSTKATLADIQAAAKAAKPLAEMQGQAAPAAAAESKKTATIEQRMDANIRKFSQLMNAPGSPDRNRLCGEWERNFDELSKEKGFNINHQNKADGNTLLHYAAKHYAIPYFGLDSSKKSFIDTFIEMKADTKLHNNDRKKPSEMMEFHPEAVLDLMGRDPQDPSKIVIIKTKKEIQEQNDYLKKAYDTALASFEKPAAEPRPLAKHPVAEANSGLTALIDQTKQSAQKLRDMIPSGVAASAPAQPAPTAEEAVPKAIPVPSYTPPTLNIEPKKAETKPAKTEAAATPAPAQSVLEMLFGSPAKSAAPIAGMEAAKAAVDALKTDKPSPQLREALDALLPVTHGEKDRAQGGPIAAVQAFFNDKLFPEQANGNDYAIPVTGNYLNTTRGSIKEFQEKHGLKTTEKLDRDTIEKMVEQGFDLKKYQKEAEQIQRDGKKTFDDIVLGNSTLRVGDAGSRVAEFKLDIQREFEAAKAKDSAATFPTIDVASPWSAKDKEAVTRYQELLNIRFPDGKLGEHTEKWSNRTFTQRSEALEAFLKNKPEAKAALDKADTANEEHKLTSLIGTIQGSAVNTAALQQFLSHQVRDTDETTTYIKVGIDGIAGNETANAIGAYQKENGLKQTNALNLETMKFITNEGGFNLSEEVNSLDDSVKKRTEAIDKARAAAKQHSVQRSEGEGYGSVPKAIPVTRAVAVRD
jgi:ankyrin repeat protein/peptidoglycan hydrolase-like protein with peptidoglycan-binding domain